MKLKRIGLLPLLIVALAGCSTTTVIEKNEDNTTAVITVGLALLHSEADLLEENTRHRNVACAKGKTNSTALASLSTSPKEIKALIIGELEKILFSQRIVSWIGKCPESK